MQWTKRRIGYRAVAVLGALALLRASSALAVAIPTDVYTLPVPGSDATTVDLGAPAPFPGTPQWLRLRPNDPTDPLADFTATVDGSAVDKSGSPTPSDAWLFNLEFTVTWNGTIDELTPTDAFGSQMLFAILDSRFGAGTTFGSTYDLAQSGFVRAAAGGSFAVDGVPVVPEIVSDATSGGGFVADHYPGDWIGFYLPATPGATHTIAMQWALGESVGSGDVFFPNALFLATVPEPGTAALVGVALLILGVGQARRRAA